MSTTMTFLDQYLDPIAAAFTPEVAERIAGMRASPVQQARLNELADKANAGTLTTAERAEYVARVEAIDLLSIIQSKARQAMGQDRR